MSNLQNISPKRKTAGLFLGFLIISLIAYQLSFSKTLENYRQYQINKKILEEAASAPSQIQQYQTRLVSYDKQFQQTTYDRATLFEKVNTFCRNNQLNLTNFAPEIRNKQQDYEVITNEIVVRGKYNEMVQLAYHLEQTTQLGHIASSSFKTVKDVQSRRQYLEGSIFLQNIQAIKK